MSETKLWISISLLRRTNIHRNTHSNPFLQERLSADARKCIEKVKGPRPKQPLSPFFRFVERIRPQVSAENPDVPKNRLYSIFTEKWKSLHADKKAIFSAAYKEDMDRYVKEVWKYNSSLTNEDLNRAQQELFKIEDAKQIKLYKEQARKLSKPKRPPPPFMKFMHLKSDRKADESSTGYVKRMSVKWNSMSETERSKYKITTKEMKNYRYECSPGTFYDNTVH